MLHRVIIVICSSGVNRVQPSGPSLSRSGPTGSISASGQWPGPAWTHHFSARSNMAYSSSHRSQKSSVIRHIWQTCLYSSAFSSRAGPGERLRTISRPQRSMARRRSASSPSASGSSRQMSSHLTKSTPQEAYRAKRLS